MLAAVLLSGHVVRGATVEVEAPFPAHAGDALRWVYTGQGGGGEGVRENVAFWGGCVEKERWWADGM